MDLHNIREDYKFDSLLEANLHKNPFDQFKNWFETYQHLGVKDANAMAIATVGEDGIPQNRIVLLKEVFWLLVRQLTRKQSHIFSYSIQPDLHQDKRHL